MKTQPFLVACAGALLVAFVYGLPYILIQGDLKTQGRQYHPLTLFSDWDESAGYAPLIKESSEKLRFTDPALREHQNTPLLLPPSGSLFLGFFVRLFGIESTWILARFFLPAAIFFLFFSIIYMMIRNEFISFCLSVIFIFTLNIAVLIPFSTAQYLKIFLLNFKPYITTIPLHHHPFSRLLSPLWTFIPLALFFLFLVIALITKKKRFLVLSGLTYGLVFYTYFYDWVIITILLGVMIVVSVFQRKMSRVREVALVLIIGLVISVFYWISFWKVAHLPQYKDIINRTGIEVGRAFRYVLVPHYIFWLICAVWLFCKRLDNRLLNRLSCLAISIFITSILVFNIQVVTGYMPQPDHFFLYSLSIPLFIAYIILVMILWRKFGAYVYKWKIFILLILVVMSTLVLMRTIQFQISYSRYNQWRYTLDPYIYDSFVWLSENLSLDAVVLSPVISTSTYLTFLTPAKVFYPPNGLLTSASNQEIIERYIIAAKLFRADDKRIRELFSYNYLSNLTLRDEVDFINSLESRSARFLLHYALASQIPGYKLGYRRFDDIEQMASITLDQWHKNPASMLAKYSFEYIYVGPYERIFFNFSNDSFPFYLKQVYKNKEVTIYLVDRSLDKDGH